MGFGDLLDVTARLLRRHARTLLLLAALFLVPTSLLHGLASVHFVDRLAPALPTVPGQPPVLTEERVRAIVDGLALLLAAGLVAALAGAMASAGSSIVVARDYHGRRASLRDAARGAVRRAFVAIGATVLSTLAILALVLGAVAASALLLALFGATPQTGGPGALLALIVIVATAVVVMLLTIRWSLAIVVAALEPVGPLHALVRSWRLTAGAARRTLGVVLLVTLTVAVLAGLVSELLALSIADLALGGATQAASIARIAISTGVAIVFAPVLPVALSVLYFDQRVRQEGLDLPVPDPGPVPAEPVTPEDAR
jgi:hypothetical protein